MLPKALLVIQIVINESKVAKISYTAKQNNSLSINAYWGPAVPGRGKHELSQLVGK